MEAKMHKNDKALTVIKNLMEACKSLMNELSQTQATDWGIVNDAMVEGQGYIVANTKKENKNENN